MAALTRKQEAELSVVLSAVREARASIRLGYSFTASQDLAAAEDELRTFIAANRQS